MDQAALSQDVKRLNPSSRIHAPVEGTIVAVHFPKDANNRSKRFIEYDVAPVIPDFGTLRNVVYLGGIHGIVDDEEIALRPAKKYLRGKDSEKTNPEEVEGAADTDGDHVVVQFLNGSYLNPVITHVIPHGFLGQNENMPPELDGKSEILSDGETGDDGYAFGDGSSGSTEADLQLNAGNRFHHRRINGTHLAVDGNGDTFINFKAHPDDDRDIREGSVTKKLVVQVEGKDVFRLERLDNEIAVYFAESFTDSEIDKLTLALSDALVVTRDGTDHKIDLGGGAFTVETDSAGTVAVNVGPSGTGDLIKVGSGALSAAVAETLNSSIWTPFQGTIYPSHVHPSAAGPTGVPNNAAPAWDSAIESEHIKVPPQGS